MIRDRRTQRPLVPPANAIELRLDMDEAAIERQAVQVLIGVHASELPKAIAHPRDDVSFLWRADGTAVANITMWQAMAPPFNHAVVAISLGFEDGVVEEVTGVERRSFGA